MAARSVLLLMLVSLAGCASTTHYVPRDEFGVAIHNARVSNRNELVNATLSHDPDQGITYGNMTVFQIAVRNVSAQPVTLTTNSFTLIDADGRQYPAMTPEEVAATSGRLYCRPRFGVDFGGSWGWPDHRAGGGIGYEDELYCDPAASNMLSDSLLPASPIKPGGKVKGLLFFRGRVEDDTRVTVELQLPGQAPLKFPFRGVRE